MGLQANRVELGERILSKEFQSGVRIPDRQSAAQRVKPMQKSHIHIP